MSTIIWMHEDALRADHPVSNQAGDTARTIFIWDDAYLKRQDYSLKRRVFIYDCACKAGAEIYRGDTEDILKAFGADAIFTAETPNPDFKAIVEALNMTVVPEEPFVNPEKTPDLKRFFRYWKAVKNSALSRNGEPS